MFKKQKNKIKKRTKKMKNKKSGVFVRAQKNNRKVVKTKKSKKKIIRKAKPLKSKLIQKEVRELSKENQKEVKKEIIEEKCFLYKSDSEFPEVLEVQEEQEEAEIIENYISPYLINLKEIEQEKQKEREDYAGKNKVILSRKVNILKINLLRRFNNYPRLSLTKTTTWELALFIFISLILTSSFFFFIFFQDLKSQFFKTRGRILGETTVALNHLLSGSAELLNYNPEEASYQFSQATQYFNKAGLELEGINNLIKETAKIIPYDQGALESANLLIEAGKNITEAASYLAEIVNVIKEPNKDFGYENREVIIINNDSLVTGHWQKNLYRKLEDFNINLTLSLQKIELANENLADIKSDIIPDDKKEKILLIKEQLIEIQKNLSKLNRLTEAGLDILAKKQLRRYLVIFQNNNELRPTGGFAGSFALVTVDRGLIKKVEFPEGGSYDIQGQLLERVKPPAALNLINPCWYFHDANWWPDFPTSAQKMIWFYEKSGGPTPDGVIAITADIMKDLLQFTGPIEVPQFNKTITADNFYEETQRAVELEYDKDANRPKKFMAAFGLEFFKKFTSEDKNIPNLFQLLDKVFRQKTIQFYFTNENLEKTFAEFNLSGQIKDLHGDYLAVINTNLRGGKTDNIIKEKVFLETTINEQGNIINTLNLERIHEGDADNFFEKITNVDYLRIYVPEGSKLLSATGFSAPDPKSYYPQDKTLADDEDLKNLEGKFEIDEISGTKIYNQFGKTVFANWAQVSPGQTAKISLTYRLPFTLINRAENKKIEEKNYYDLFLEKLLNKDETLFQEDLRTYTFFIQKQAGDNNLIITHKINLPSSWKLIWQNKEPDQDLNLLQDNFYGAIYRVNNLTDN